ncbi:PARP10_14_15 [Mytilus edulis]|uniref:PARP10_14_15 n=1 Tax=Mytilus edulis TaxID=6550 RepID=A0A8S3U9N5_MYTED|nr:PARP10_14_15 [Mytilus edulis]
MAEETQDRKNRDEWKPPDDMVPDNQSTSSWKSAWKQIIIKVTLEDGKEIGTTDATGTLMPVKMQGFLEVIVKSEPSLGVISEIVNCLTNEFDEVVLKTVPKLPFTLQMAEEVLQKQLAAKNIDLLEDNTTMFIVGFYNSKSLMNKLIEQITSSSVKKAVSLDEKWKTMALKRFGLLEQLSQRFHDVSIRLQEEQNCVYFHGRDIKVQEVINAMNKCLSSLLMKKIQFDPLVIELLTCSEASRLFCETLEKENIQLVWKVNESGAGSLQFYCNQDIDVCIVKSAIYENFLSTGLSTLAEGCENANAFLKSQIFTDIIAKNKNKLLVCKYTDRGVLIASTKEIIKDLFHQEKLFRKRKNTSCVSRSVQVDTIVEEVSKLKSEKVELETHIQHLEMKLKLVGKEVVATNNTAYKNLEQIQHIDTSKQEARDKHATFMNKDKAAQVAMPKAKKLSDSFIQSTNCQSFITKEEIVIRVYVGSILKLNVEGIVNASNGTLSHGGGIADVISRAAGYAFQQESDAYIQRNGSLKDGECCSTSAGNLQYKCVIHAIGPKWYDYPTDKRQCASVLQRTIENCLHEAETNGLISVAVPSISAGV